MSEETEGLAAEEEPGEEPVLPDPFDEDFDGSTLTQEEGEQLLLEVYAELEAAVEREAEPDEVAELLYWLLAHEQWLPDTANYDWILLTFIRQLLLLNELGEALAAREHLDLELVESDPAMHAEHLLHTVAIARMKGDIREVQRLLRESADVIAASPEEEHRMMFGSIVRGLGFMVSDVTSGLRERAVRGLGSGHPELEVAERVLAGLTRMQAGDTSVQLENELVEVARSHDEHGLVEATAFALYAAAMVASQRADPRAAAARAHEARQVLCSRQATAQSPMRPFIEHSYATLLAGLGRKALARLVLDNLVRNPALSDADLILGLAHLTSAFLALEDDPWSGLGAALTAHALLTRVRDSLPAAGERRSIDPMLGAAAEAALRAVARIDDPWVTAEVIEHLRAQGLPGAPAPDASTAVGDGGVGDGVVGPGAGVLGAVTPVWALLDVVGVPTTRPAWATEHEDEPALLTGARPRVRMPWGDSLVTPMLAPHRDGQIVAIHVPR